MYFSVLLESSNLLDMKTQMYRDDHEIVCHVRLSRFSMYSSCKRLYYAPKVRRGKYWVLGLFLLQYFPRPLVNI